MKTTIDLPDELLVAAKKKAAELRKPLRELIEAGLRLQLTRRPSRAAAGPRKIRWVTVAGGVPVDVTDREAMHNWLGRQPQ